MSSRLALAGVVTLAFATPALAQPASLPPQPGVVDAQGRVYDGPQPAGLPDPRPEWHGGGAPMGHGQQVHYPPQWEQARANWLNECRRRHGSGNKVGGAVVGGLVGGVIGNRVAGRGNRVVGTVAGAAVGAVAGGAIGDSADRRAARDWCESYLEQNTTWSQGYGPGYGQQIAGYGYAPMMVMVPVAYVAVQAPAPARECKETIVTEEWVTVPSKPRYRYITTTRRVPDKRIRIVPDKRVRIVPDKRVRTN
ncbi:MAG: glycine zipper 2TM domain-containing protein [Sphingomonadales bacterium]|nr:glycine zipper 2TM domain-containing protein [Sphingomonadales bacterium]